MGIFDGLNSSNQQPSRGDRIFRGLAMTAAFNQNPGAGAAAIMNDQARQRDTAQEAQFGEMSAAWLQSSGADPSLVNMAKQGYGKQAFMMHQQNLKTAQANQPKHPTFGKTPIYGQVNGKTALGAMSDQGKFTQVETGDFTPSTGMEKVDAGTHWVIKDKRTGQNMGIIPKNNAEAEGQKDAGKQGIKLAGEAYTSLGKTRKNIANISNAIAALDRGANTGAIAQYFPSIQTASIELDNVQKRLGLDVIGDVTFGALSKGELDLALATAIPTNMNPQDLKQWLIAKKAAQEKYSTHLMRAARFLSKPGNTLNDWLEINGADDPHGQPQQPNQQNDPLGIR